MSAHPDFIPERSNIDQRIERCYQRMLGAKTEAWRHAWGDALVVNCSARNAMRTVAEVRQLEKARGLR
jgi:hypothetical protein